MISGKQILWGTLGWAFGGPIGGILVLFLQVQAIVHTKQ